MSPIPADHVNPGRRQSLAGAVLPAGSISAVNPTPSVIVPAHSDTRTSSTPLSTIITLTVTSVVIFVAFALYVVYRLQRFKIEEIKRRYSRSRMIGELARHKKPENPPRFVQKENHSSNVVADPCYGPQKTRAPISVRFSQNQHRRKRLPISELSSISSSESEPCSCKTSEKKTPRYPSPIRPCVPRYVPRINKLPTMRPKPHYPRRSGWYIRPSSHTDSNVTGDPFGSPRRTRGVNGISRSREQFPRHGWPPHLSNSSSRHTDGWIQSSPGKPPPSR